MTKTPFANNTIPTNRLSPQALAIQAFEPLPNTTSNTASSVSSGATDFNQYTVRLDHQINSSNRLFARWIYVQNREVDPDSSPLLGTANLTSIGQDIVVGLITNLGANKINEARVHYLPSHVRLSAFLQGPDFNDQFGVAGFAPQIRPGTGGSFPDYAWTGYGSLQGSTFDQRPKSQDRKAVEGYENFTLLKGKQSLKFGVLIRYYQWLGYDSSTYAGQFNFPAASAATPMRTFSSAIPQRRPLLPC